MRTTQLLTLLSACAVVVLLAACGQDSDRIWDDEILPSHDPDGSLPGEFIPDDGENPEIVQPAAPRPVDVAEIGLLALLNDRELTDHYRLDMVCGVRGTAATSIITYRNGADGELGNGDDNLFESQAEVEELPEVGDYSVAQLIDCAERFAYLPAPEEATVLALLNDRTETDTHLLDVRCAIRRDSARNLIAYRNGADGTPGTSDDDLFHTMEEVEAVSMVGDWTISKLTNCASRLGYVVEDDSIGDSYLIAELIEDAAAE